MGNTREIRLNLQVLSPVHLALFSLCPVVLSCFFVLQLTVSAFLVGFGAGTLTRAALMTRSTW